LANTSVPLKPAPAKNLSAARGPVQRAPSHVRYRLAPDTPKAGGDPGLFLWRRED